MSKVRNGRVFEAFKAAVLRHGMIAPGDRVLVGCSGGPDSVALTSLLLRLREEMPLEISVAHFNHRLRTGAKDDESFVRELTRRWVLPLITGSKDVRRVARRRKLNLEETARLLRYEFLRGAARKAGATKIATGHTMNDQAETILMRLFRGTGLAGLAGIEPVSGPTGCPVIRPLLGIRREDLEAYLRDEGLGFRTDDSNLDRKRLRNRIRLGLLPEIERNYSPRIVKHLAALSTLAREEDSLLAGIGRELADEFITRSGGETALDVRTLSLLPLALARRVTREFIRELKGNLRAVSFDDVASVLALGEGKEKSVKKGLVLRREHGRLFPVVRKTAARRFELAWDGRKAITVAGSTFVGRKLGKNEAPSLRSDDRSRAAVDLAKLSFPLVVRSRRPGDLYRPLGAPGRKKLKEILRAKGVPREDRDRLPVFLSRGEIVWVPGLPVAEEFKVGAATKRLFLVEKTKTVRRTQRR
jgi:tRNA(Ile)-lysidine synthase